MTDKAKLAEQQERGAHAERLLNDKLFQEFLHKAETNLIEQFKASALGDHETRHHSRVALGVLDLIRRNFEHCIQTGKFATHELAELKEEKAKD